MSSSNSEIRPLVNALQTLLNKQLQQICATHGLRTSGVKAELQNRIKNALEEVYTADRFKFDEIRETIRSFAPGVPKSSPQPAMYGQSNGKMYAAPGYHFNLPRATGYGNTGASGSSNGHKNSAFPRDLQFKPSPFYSPVSRIGEMQTLEAMSQHRNTVHIPIRVSDHPDLTSLGKTWRVMVFCAGENQGVQEIAFPHQSELKVNGGEIKANLRGLKGKPGTTRPVDVTDSLRLRPANYNNNIEFTYALTPKKFYLAAYLCKLVSVDDLVAKIKSKKITKATVLQEMTKNANDPDVVATSTVLSLKCPLSYTRLRTPCRSILCNHIQCFDATSYLQLQEQGPQWVCPICQKSAPFENLAVDDYVRDILDNTSDSLEQVTIEPDGEWRSQMAQATPSRKLTSSFANASIDVDDDLSVVADNTSYSNGKFGTPNIYDTAGRSLIGASASVSREPSGTPKSKGKRTATEVIDLTLSSDEDDAPPVRPKKRQYTGPSPDSYDGFDDNPFHAPGSHY